MCGSARRNLTLWDCVGLCFVQVVWDDSIMRLFVVPTAVRPLGLVFRAIKGQVDFETPLGERGTLYGGGWGLLGFLDTL